MRKCRHESSEAFRRQPRTARFTLVELMVVVTIITILLVLLLPALGTARQIARQTVCAGNLRQIGLGMLKFTTDYNGRFPRGALHPIYGDCGWYSIMNELVFKNPNAIPWRCYNEADFAKYKLVCPEYGRFCNGRPMFAMNYYAAGGWDYYGSKREGDYGKQLPQSEWPPPFTADNGWTQFYLGAPITMFKRPSSTFLVMDVMDAGAGIFRCENSGSSPATPLEWLPDFRHGNNTANYLFIDGHVKPFHFTDNDINLSSRFNYSGED